MSNEVETVTTTETQETPKVEAKQPTDKVFTQDDVNKIVAERLERERSALAKSLGQDKFDRDEITKQYQNTQQALEAERQAKAELEQQLTVAQQEAVGLRFGVKPDKLKEALTLAQLRVSDEVSLEDAIQQVANEYTNLTSVKVRGGVEVGDNTTPKNPYITDALIKRYPHLAKNKK